jgi:hypothetical protein
MKVEEKKTERDEDICSTLYTDPQWALWGWRREEKRSTREEEKMRI